MVPLLRWAAYQSRTLPGETVLLGVFFLFMWRSSAYNAVPAAAVGSEFALVLGCQQIMLHKDTIVKLPEEKARADGSLETPRHKLLKPGEECRVADMDPISEPTDAQLKIMADCLDGQDPTDYTWVKVPMGVTFTNEGESSNCTMLPLSSGCRVFPTDLYYKCPFVFLKR